MSRAKKNQHNKPWKAIVLIILLIIKLIAEISE